MKDVPQLPTFPRTSFVEKNVVIRKEKVGDSWTVATNRYACETLVSGCPINESREPLGTNKEKSRGEGVPLLKPPGRNNVSTSSPIYDD